MYRGRFKRLKILGLGILLLGHVNIAHAAVISQDYVVSTPREIQLALFLYKNNIKDIYAWVKWLEQNVVYAKDFLADCWNDPKTTIQQGFGDCEDFAILNRAVLRVLGNEAQLYVVDSKEGPHAICIFRYRIAEDYYYGVLNNSKLRVTTETKFEDLERLLEAEFGYRNLRRHVS